MMITFKKKKVILKLDSYRKLIRNVNLLDFYKKKIILVCNSLYFSGYSLKLLKEFFMVKQASIYNYKDNFYFLMLTSKNRNYLYNYKSKLVKNIFFFFNDFNEIYLFLNKIKVLSLSPYMFYPVSIFTPMKNITLSYNILNFYFKNYKYKYYQNSFFYYIYVNIIKKTILIIFIFIVLKINIIKI